ncbi:MAG: type II secretion system F family protein, partial [Candidatus Thermoplasmatota archaeon]|nr:type II secretion system F family protein [Candidatus Thermoplasmatota archaeon]
MIEMKRVLMGMETPIDQYVIRFALPIIATCFISQQILLWFFPAVKESIVGIIILVMMPVGGIIFVVLKPILEADRKRTEIDDNMHLFITRMGALSTSNLPRKRLFEILSKVEEYGALSQDIGRIYVLMEHWNLALPEAARHIAKRTPSIILADFLERMGHAVETGEDFHSFLSKEQTVVMNDYQIHYEGALKGMDLIKEIFVSLVASSMFMI